MKIYRCDNCRKDFSDASRMLEIGTPNNGVLLVQNNLKNRKIFQLSNYTNLHFCSKNCFVSFFFEEEAENFAPSATDSLKD